MADLRFYGVLVRKSAQISLGIVDDIGVEQTVLVFCILIHFRMG